MTDHWISTPRLAILPPSDHDFEDLYRLQSSQDVMYYIGQGVPRSKAEVEKTLTLLMKHYDQHGCTLARVIEKETGQFVGRAGLVYLELDDKQPDIEIGYALLPEFWGKGYATELAKHCAIWGFDNLQVERLVGVTHLENKASQRVLEKIGMHHSGYHIYSGQKVMFHHIERSAFDVCD